MFNRILVAIDFTAASDAALECARQLAARLDGSLHLVHVAENDFLRPIAGDPHDVGAHLAKWLDDRLTDDDRRRGGTVTVLRSDDAAEALLAHVRAVRADLIVLGTHGRSNLSHALRSSVAERVVREAPCPVLTGRQTIRAA